MRGERAAGKGEKVRRAAVDWTCDGAIGGLEDIL